MSVTIFYVKPSSSSFVIIDQAIISSKFNLITSTVNTNNRFVFVKSVIVLILKLLLNIFRYKIIYTRFADYHAGILALFSWIFRKKLVIVVGGHDVYHIPEFDYGLYTNPFRAVFAKFALNNAYMLLPNSKAMIYNVNVYATGNPIYAGIKHFAPNTKAIIRLLYNGFDTQKWTCSINQSREGIVTVAYINDLRTWKMKGLDLFLEVALKMPQYTFTIIGVNPEFKNKFLSELPENVRIVEPLPNAELADWYARSRVFCLLSLSEGMPNVLCEAMLCGCIPVVSDVAPLPEIIGTTGFVVHKKDVQLAISAITAAYSNDSNNSAARQQVVNNFSFELRKSQLIDILESMTAGT